MIFDNTLIFDNDAAITADRLSTNIIDLGNTGTPFGGRKIVADFGKGTEIPIFLHTTATFNTLTSLTVELRTSANEDMSSHKVVASANYPLAELVAGKELRFPAAVLEGTDRRYMALYYDVVGTNPTTGKVTAGIVAARQTNFAGHY
jgi:hypothetical protein